MTAAPAPPPRRGALARRYAVFVALVICLAMGLNGVVNTIFAFADQRALIVRVQKEQAQAAAGRISAFVSDILNQLDWVAQNGPESGSDEDRRLDGLRLLRQTPAIVDLRQIDAQGHEYLALSRFERDRIGSGADWSDDESFRAALEKGVFYGSVDFRRGSEPYVVLAKRSRSSPPAVVRATVNLTYIRDLVARLKVGDDGRAYIVERSGRLIAHPDLRFVLRNTNLSDFLAAHDAVAPGRTSTTTTAGISARDIEGRAVLSVIADVPELHWYVVVDLPQSEAFAPIYTSLLRSLLILIAALVTAVVASILLSRRLVAPITALSEGAARIGEGQLDERIAISSNDELRTLGDQFNLMAERLQENRAALEDKVMARTAALADALDQASAGQRAAEQARRQAEEATLAKSRFLAVVGHDIRTPLSGVLGVLEILDRKRMSQRDRRLVEMAAASGETLIDLANATLDLSRLEAGTESLELRDYEPATLLETAAALMRPSAARKGLALGLDIAAVASLRLHGDPGKISRIVLNLLRNAVSFTDAGHIGIAAKIEAGAASDPVLAIAVVDTGVGIEPAMQRKVFQDFVQVDPETGRRSGGVGLGLAICTRLASLLGGGITVVSAPGRGSTFSVRLPATPAKDAARPAGMTAADRPLAVLVVDDEPITREVARIMIAKAGHKVFQAGSGEAALVLLRKHNIDLVLLDMHMTGIDGIETATAIRAMPDIVQPKIVALTADVSPDTMRRLRRAGLTTILSKPTTSAALRQVLGRGPVTAGTRGGATLAPDRAVDEGFLRDQGELIGMERLGRLVTLFSRVSDDLLDTMQRALHSEDRTELARAAHQLSSSAGALGLGQVLAKAAALESTAGSAPLANLTAAVAGLIQAREDALKALSERRPKAVTAEV